MYCCCNGEPGVMLAILQRDLNVVVFGYLSVFVSLDRFLYNAVLRLAAVEGSSLSAATVGLSSCPSTSF